MWLRLIFQGLRIVIFYYYWLIILTEYGQKIRHSIGLVGQNIRRCFLLLLYYKSELELEPALIIISNLQESMKYKARKSFEPSNLPDSTRTREKFFTGVKKQQFYSEEVARKQRKQNYLQDTLQCYQPGQYMPQDSVLTIQEQGYSKEDLIRVFQSFSNKKPYICEEDLTQFLRDQNEDEFKKYEMIRMLDGEGKGYVTLDEFLSFYLDNKIAKENSQEIPEKLLHKQAWRASIEQNYQVLEKLKDKQYCAYVANEVRRLKDVNLNISSNR